MDSSVFSDEMSTEHNQDGEGVAAAASTAKPAHGKSRFFRKRNTFYISSDDEKDEKVVENNGNNDVVEEVK